MSSPYDAKQAYLYVQFESRRRGYIDDVEFLLADGTMQLRTSSRLGYLDLGVNAKVSLYLSGKIKKTVMQNSHASIFPQYVAHTNLMSARVNQSQSSRPPRCMFVSYSCFARIRQRFNWLARRFGSLNGWSASPILQKGHEEYFSLNQITDADVDGSKGTPVTKSEKIKL